MASCGGRALLSYSKVAEWAACKSGLNKRGYLGGVYLSACLGSPSSQLPIIHCYAGRLPQAPGSKLPLTGAQAVPAAAHAAVA